MPRKVLYTLTGFESQKKRQDPGLDTDVGLDLNSSPDPIPLMSWEKLGKVSSRYEMVVLGYQKLNRFCTVFFIEEVGSASGTHFCC